MARHWRTVLAFESCVTPTVSEDAARASRRPATKISRITMTRAAITGTSSVAVRTMMTPHTSTLSAMGSRMRPRVEWTFMRRASQPSRASVAAATQKMASAAQRAFASPFIRRNTIGTRATMRVMVRMLGSDAFMSGDREAESSCRARRCHHGSRWKWSRMRRATVRSMPLTFSRSASAASATARADPK